MLLLKLPKRNSALEVFFSLMCPFLIDKTIIKQFNQKNILNIFMILSKKYKSIDKFIEIFCLILLINKIIE
jgi:hypothetical protein